MGFQAEKQPKTAFLLFPSDSQNHQNTGYQPI
jgi:hypothetical protein